MDALAKMPVLFVGHGSPMNAIEDNNFSLAWRQLGESIPKPEAILCVSAHWETRGTFVTSMNHPKTIHDFYGFPRELNEMLYPAPGSAALVKMVTGIVKAVEVQPDTNRGLDHGAWSVLCRMYPQADIPVVQLSLNRSEPEEFHYTLGQELAALREQGILILGSGNIAHNLRVVNFNIKAYDWAEEFDHKVQDLITAGEHDPLVHYERHGNLAALSVNSAEHYLPLLYVLGAGGKQDEVTFFCEEVVAGSISMRCVQIG